MSTSFGLTPNPTTTSVPVTLQVNSSSSSNLVWQMAIPGGPVTYGTMPATPPTTSIPMTAAPGTYQLGVLQDGSSPLSQSITVPNSSAPVTIPVNMVATSDAGVSASPPATPINTAIASNLSTTVLPPTPEEEFIYPNDSYNKYFTATQARIYVGDLFIDEVDTLQFVLQDNAVPIFGYSSRYLDAYGQGRSLVQGQLALNFVTEGYLYTVLQNVSEMAFPETTAVNTSWQSQLDGYQASKTYLSSQPQTVANSAALDYVNQQIQQLVANVGPSGVQYMRKYIESRTQAPDSYRINPVYQPVLFDLEMHLGEGPTLRVRRLEKIKLTSNEMIVSQDGRHLLDSYGFLARRLR